MIRRPLTAIELSSEDIEQFEAVVSNVTSKAENQSAEGTNKRGDSKKKRSVNSLTARGGLSATGSGNVSTSDLPTATSAVNQLATPIGNLPPSQAHQ